jgi:hypothetical protein
MRIPIFLRLMVISLLPSLVSCGPRSDNRATDHTDAMAIQKAAEDYLRPLLHAGESEANLVSRFGPPAFRSGTPTNGVCLTFYLPDGSNAEKIAAICGFEAFFVSNRLSSWLPIYVSSPTESTQYTSKTPDRTRQLPSGPDQALLSFHLVSPEQRSGTTFVDSHKFPSLGYMSTSPDVVIRSGYYTVHTSANEPNKCEVEFLLSDEDSQKLGVLTGGNVGKRVAMLVGSNIVAAPYVASPILSGRVALELPKAEGEALFRQLEGVKR